MNDVSVTTLRRNLLSYLERARRGERFRVTSRGQVIAELSGPAATTAEAKLIRRQLRGSVLHYEAPIQPAYERGEWTTALDGSSRIGGQ